MATKPVISYTAGQVPLNTELNVSIVQKKVSKTEYRNWNDKSEWTTYTDTLYVPPTSDSYVFIRCQCGETYDYVNSAAVPATNVTCSCGRKVIEYGS